MLVKDLRKLFLQYYQNNDHTLVPSSNLVPTNDDTLLFTNSGMVQFKNIFTSLQKSDYTKAVSAQKCIRAGGKHNDLDNVGYTARHHTFFEMLGNFSFGDYFKEQAIYYAWDFINNQLTLPKDKLCVTVYHTDTEAYNLWKKISGLGDDKIIKINTDDNFWSMGETGPCGPCSEIFYDYGDSVLGGPPGSINQDGDRFVEIWNLVFMEFERDKKGILTPLRRQSIDTGMGLERLASVMQGKQDNYNTDIFVTIINTIQEILKVKVTPNNKIAFKVISDHLRSIAFLISEGIIPSNEGRGYVLRRIIRRAIRYAYFLNAKEPVLYKIVTSVINSMGNYYIQLVQKRDLIISVLHQEEIKFFDTFANGIKLLNKEINNQSGGTFSGVTAFKLYDTYGFPVDLTQSILQQNNITLNIKEFEQAFENHKNLAKKSWAGSGENKDNPIWFNLANKYNQSKFTGYTNTTEHTEITCLLNDNLEIVDSLSQDQEGYIILNKTPFYATMGGQLGDEGNITNNTANAFISTTIINNNIIAHKAKILKGTLNTKDTVVACINVINRNLITKHHTAVHLLQAALIKILGNHITQQGSSVTATRLRFDTSHPKPITKEELLQVENIVNTVINKALPITIQNIKTTEAIEQGALAMFGEKYPEIARTVKIQDSTFLSFELCGGTHVNNTSEIGVFKIISEGSLASGIRRIEAVCSTALLQNYNDNLNLLNTLNKITNTGLDALAEKITNLVESNKLLQNQLISSNNKYYKAILKDKFISINNKSILCQVIETETKNLRDIATLMLQNKQNSIVALFNIENSICNGVVAITKDLTNNIDLKEFSKQINTLLQGNGGGNNVLIQTKGNSNYLTQAIETIKAL